MKTLTKSTRELQAKGNKKEQDYVAHRLSNSIAAEVESEQMDSVLRVPDWTSTSNMNGFIRLGQDELALAWPQNGHDSNESCGGSFKQRHAQS